MDTETLRMFLRIAELGSFGRAAQVLNLSQPTLSRRIALLEHEVKVQLFVRNRRGVGLTAAGEALAGRAHGLLRQLDDLQGEISALDAQPSGLVSIGLPPSLIDLINGPLIARVSQLYPNITLYIHEGISNLVEEKLVNGELDLGLMFATRSELRNISSTILATEEMVLTGAPGSQPSRNWISVDEIAELPLVLYRLPNYIRWRVDVAFRQKGLTPKIIAEVNTLPMLLEFAFRGVGSVILPRSAVIRHIESKSLIGSTIRGLTVKWALEVSNARKEVPAVKALTHEIRALFHTQITSGHWSARERRD